MRMFSSFAIYEVSQTNPNNINHRKLFFAGEKQNEEASVLFLGSKNSVSEML